MATKLPSEEAVTILFAEDIRFETSGRVTIVGLFPGRNLGLSRKVSNDPRFLNRNAVYIEIAGGNGSYEGQFVIHSPSGKEIHIAELGNVELAPDRAMFIVGQNIQLDVSEDGIYLLELRLGKRKKYCRTLTVVTSEENGAP